LGRLQIDSAISLTTGVTKSGQGLAVLTGANTYTRATIINEGTLQFAKQVALYNNVTANWTATNINVAAGATLALNVGGTGEFTTSDVATISGLGTGTAGLLNGATLALDTTNGDFSHATAITNTNSGANSIGLRKLGANTLTLSGPNTYTGLTTVSVGTLIINGTSSGNGGLMVASGATFGRATTSALTLGGTTTFATGSKIALTLGNGANSSLNRSSGDWTFASNEAFVFDLTYAVAGTTYQILTGLASAENIAGWTWSSNMAGATGSFAANATGVDFILTAVPEPATWGLLAFSLTTVAILRRRRVH
jgi:autotransporter-associated beta strand protein